jgi:iron complex outermembrane receptor protein
MDFSNGLTYASDGNGNFGRANGGKTRFLGYELEARYALTPQLQLAAHYAYHDAYFVEYALDDGTNVSGNRIEMSPRQLGGVGLMFADAGGWSASVIADFVSNRMLNKRNTVKVGGYTTIDASLGYRIARYRLQLNGYNLGNRRDPVAESELNEAVTVTGTAGYYRLPARSYALSLTFAL